MLIGKKLIIFAVRNTVMERIPKITEFYQMVKLSFCQGLTAS